MKIDGIDTTSAGLSKEPSTCDLPYDPKVEEGQYILTPPESPMPRIHGPAVFGVRPGSPFLYAIPATGKGVMRFGVEALPAGLNVNEDTGLISGTIESDERREYRVTFRVENDLGEAEKYFKIRVGGEICLTPPLGWNSWNCWGRTVSQEKVLASAEAMRAKGLAKYGWTYINIDDGWQHKRGSESKSIQAIPEKFPDIKKLCDDIHSLGLKVGIYSTPWKTTYAGFIGGSSDDPDGVWDEDSMGHSQGVQKTRYWHCGDYAFDEVDAKQWAEWGIDYLKYDWKPNDSENTLRMAKALKESGRDIVYSLSNCAPLEDAELFAEVANCWRTTGDLKDRWDRKGRNLNLRQVWENHRTWMKTGARGGPGHFPDADMLVVGHVIEDNTRPEPKPSRLTADEQYTHISMWTLWASPLLIGCPIELMDDFTLGLLTNSEVLDIHQDEKAIPGRTIFYEQGIEIVMKDLADGEKAIGIFNVNEEAEVVNLKWDLIGLSGRKIIRDLWRQADVGEFENAFSTNVRAHGTILLRTVSPNS